MNSPIPTGTGVTAVPFKTRPLLFQANPLSHEQVVDIVGSLNAKILVSPRDLRRFPRFPVLFVVKGQGLNDKWLPKGVPFKGTTMNVSTGGILFGTEAIIDVPLIQISILNGHDVLAERIVRVIRCGVGTVAGQFVKHS
jgi:hypothetical protein